MIRVGPAGAFFALFYAAQFLVLGVQSPFLPGWLQSEGFTPREIGLLTGAAVLARITLGPAVGRWADRVRDSRRVVRLIALSFAIAGIGLLLAPGKPVIAFFAVLLIWSLGVLTPLTDAGALAGDRAGRLKYGRIRAVGSGAFLCATLLGGALLGQFGVGATVAFIAAGAIGTALLSLAMPAPERVAAPTAAVDARGAGLLRDRRFLLFLAAAALVQGSHAAYYAFSVIHWRSLNISPETIGALWATGVAVEILVLTRGRTLLARARPTTLLAIGASAAVVRWSLTATDPPVAALFLLQALHGATFATAFLGAMAYVARRVPPESINSAMTILSTTAIGGVTGLATVAAGFAFERAGASAAYGLMAAMGGAALIASLALRRKRQRGAAGTSGADDLSNDARAKNALATGQDQGRSDS